MGMTIGDFLAAVTGIAGPAGGYIGLLLIIYLVGIGGQLVTRRECDALVEAEKRVNETNVTNHTEIIKLKDERIAFADGEAERWKHEAMTALALRESPQSPHRGQR